MLLSVQALSVMLIDSFGNDFFLDFVDKLPGDHIKQKFVFQSLAGILQPWGFSESQPEGREGAWDSVPEGISEAVGRVLSFSKAVVCLLDAQPLVFGSSAKDVYPFAKYAGGHDLEVCLRDNLKKKFWQERYQSEQQFAGPSKMLAMRLAEAVADTMQFKGTVVQSMDGMDISKAQNPIPRP